jgi:phosphatidylglycerophosphate synthase
VSPAREVAETVGARGATTPSASGGKLTLKGRDCWWTVLVIDPVAAPLVSAVRPFRRITPNVLTAASVVAGIAAGAAYALDHLVAGALLFQASFLLDCMDGKLAHSRGLRSRYGSYLDAVGDAVRFACCTAGLVFGLASQGDTAVGWVTVLAMFPTLHYVRLTTQAAWPDDQRSEPCAVPASPTAVLRAAPGRLSKPGTTVDTEALAFTIGPLAGVPLLGILVATVIDGARLVVSMMTRVWRSAREAEARTLDGQPHGAAVTKPRRIWSGGPADGHAASPGREP